MARPLNCSDDEWQARLDLAACYRIFHLLGWTEMIYNHISLRVPGPDRHFLINPFGLHYSEVCASNLLKVDLQGQVLSDSAHRVNAAGFHPHATLHGNIADAHCVMHTHTTAGMAVASSAAGLQITNFYAAQLGGRSASLVDDRLPNDGDAATIHLVGVSEIGPRLHRRVGHLEPRRPGSGHRCRVAAAVGRAGHRGLDGRSGGSHVRREDRVVQGHRVVDGELAQRTRATAGRGVRPGGEHGQEVGA